jgi:hypothetical protein
MIDLLKRTIRDRWDSLGLEGDRPDRLSFHLSGDGSGKHGRAIVRVFRPGGHEPFLLAKIPRDAAARGQAAQEHDLLRALEEAAPRLAGRRFPRCLLLEVKGGRLVTVQTMIQGLPLEHRIDESAGDSDAVRLLHGEAEGWLAEFWRETGLLEGSETALWEPFLRSAHSHLQSCDDARERVAARAVIAAIEAHRDETSLSGFGHGEFAPGNLVGRLGHSGAVDWELGRRRAMPWVDVISFAVELAARIGTARGEGRVAGFTAAFLEDGPLRDATRSFLDTCLAEGRVPRDRLAVALPAWVLARAHRAARGRSPRHPAAREWREIARTCLLAREAVAAAVV